MMAAGKTLAAVGRALFFLLAWLAGMACRVIGVICLVGGVIRAWFAWRGMGITEIGPPSWPAACAALLAGLFLHALPELLRSTFRGKEG